MAALDATCAWVNPGLVLVAVTLALFNLTAAAQRWAAAHQLPPASVRNVVVTVAAEKCGSSALLVQLDWQQADKLLVKFSIPALGRAVPRYLSQVSETSKFDIKYNDLLHCG